VDDQHGVALSFEVPTHDVGLLGVVFGDQDAGAHRRSVSHAPVKI
jgi:hypothetical protein